MDYSIHAFWNSEETRPSTATGVDHGGRARNGAVPVSKSHVVLDRVDGDTLSGSIHVPQVGSSRFQPESESGFGPKSEGDPSIGKWTGSRHKDGFQSQFKWSTFDRQLFRAFDE